MSMDPEALLAHRDFVRALARKLVADDSRVDDVEQETWLSAIEHEPATDRSLRPWLASVARNVARMITRAESRRATHERAASRREREPSAAEIVERELARRKVVDAVLALEEPYRETILFRYFEHLPPREIARRHGVPVETVKTRLKRALDRLRARLDREHGGDRASWCLVLLPLARSSRVPIATAFGGVLLMKLGTKIGIAAVVIVAAVFFARWAMAPEKFRAELPAASAASDSAAARRVIAPVEPTPPSVASSTPASTTPAVVGHITGHVIDHAGSPIANARVIAYPDDVTEAVRAEDALAGKGCARATTTDATGRFAVPLAETSPLYTLVAEATDYSPGSLEPVRAEADVEITFDPPRALVGQVMDIEGKPIAGARVKWVGAFCGSRVEREGSSRADGTYRVEGLPSKAAASKDYMYRVYSIIQVEAADFTPLIVDRSESSRDNDAVIEKDLVLIKGSTLTGRVIDAETDEPLVGARIVVADLNVTGGLFRPRGSVLRGVFEPLRLAEASTDDHGRFTVTRIPARGFHWRPRHTGKQGNEIGGYVCAVVDGYAPCLRELAMVADGATIEMDFECWPIAAVTGRVVDSAGKPMSDVAVRVDSERGDGLLPSGFSEVPSATGSTDSNGRYSIGFVPAARGVDGIASIVACYPGCYVESKLDVSVRANQITPVPDLVVTPERSAIIRVVDEDGRPVSRAEVESYGRRTRPADATGVLRYFFAWESWYGAPTASKRLIVRARGYATTTTPEFVPSSESPPEIRVVLSKEQRISGRVLLEDGSPASDTEVIIATSALSMTDALDRDLNKHMHSDDLPLPPVFCKVRVDADGSFEVGGLPSETFNLRARREQYPRQGGPCDSVEVELTGVPAGSTGLAMTLPKGRPLPQTTMVEGTLVDSRSGRPIPRFYADLIGEDPWQRTWAHVLPGRFRFPEAPVGTWTLQINADGYPRFERKDVVVAPGDIGSPLNIRLDRGLHVHGVVRKGSDLDLTGAEVLFVGPSGQPQPKAAIAADGSYEATGFQPGRYVPVVRRAGQDLHLRGPIWAALETATVVVVESGDDVECSFTAVRAGRLYVSQESSRLPRHLFDKTDPERGRVSAASRAEVRNSHGDIVDAWSHLENESGRILYLAPGEYTVRIEIPGSEPREQRVTVEADEIAEAILDFP